MPAASSWLSLLLPLLPLPQDPIANAAQAVATAVAQHGDGSLEHADALVKQSQLLLARGQFAAAMPVCTRALAIRRSKLPANHPRLAIALSNVAACQMQLGDHAAAAPLLQEARDIFLQNPPAPGTIGVMNNLAVCQSQLGHLADARATAEAAAAYGRQHKPDHPYTAMAIKSLAGICVYYGELEQARRLVEEALALLERVEPGGPRHLETLAGIVDVYLGADRIEEALPLQRQLLTLRERAGDPLPTATAQLKLARIEYQLRDLATARERAAAAIAALPADAPAKDRAWAHATYAQLAAHDGDHAAARKHAELGLAATPPGSPLAATLAKVLGVVEIRSGDPAAGVARLRAAQAAFERHAIGTMNLTESRLALAEGLQALGDLVGAVAPLRANLRELPGQLERSVPGLREQSRLQSVARQRDSLARLLALTRNRPDVLAAADQHEEILVWKGQVARSSQRQLAALRARPETAARLQRVAELRDRIAAGEATADMVRELERLESTLSIDLPTPDPRQELAALRAQLPAGTAFVDWFVYDPPQARRQLIAFVVRNDRPTVRVEFGDWATCAEVIDATVQLTARALRPGAARLWAPAATLARQRLWEPLLPALAGCTEVCLSPDAALAYLPFETLPGAQPGTFLVEDLAIRYLQNGRELLAPAPPLPPSPRLLAIGAIDYGEVPTPSAEPIALRGAPRPFLPLPGTARELDAITGLWSHDATVLRGQQAHEAAITDALPQATFVHLATHGFTGFGDDTFAGVALATANRPTGDRDGILSAAEAEFLDLRQCRLVVLSACQTGLGRPTAGESLLGLRRSLHIAGAAATLTSLWRIDDAATVPLMTAFYRALWQDGKAPAAALREAQLAALTRARREHGEGLPGLWGAFVLEGR